MDNTDRTYVAVMIFDKNRVESKVKALAAI